MRKYRWLGFIIFVFVLSSCLPNDDKNTGNQGENIETSGEDITGFSNFLTGFKEMQLPYYLPNPDAVKNEEKINKEEISNYFGDAKLSAAFENDKTGQPITANLDSAEYFYDSKLINTNGFTGIIIRKKYKGNFYYLITTGNDGSYIDGMCIAFSGEKNRKGLERSASINEDLSIQVREENLAASKSETIAPSRFFEITPEGKISGIQLGI